MCWAMEAAVQRRGLMPMVGWVVQAAAPVAAWMNGWSQHWCRQVGCAVCVWVDA